MKKLGVIKKTVGGVNPDGEPLAFSYYASAPGRYGRRDYRDDEVADAVLGATTGDVGINDTLRFLNVPAAVWAFEIGGYQVLKKWLGYRHVGQRDGAPMTTDELKAFRDLVHRVATVINLRSQLATPYRACSTAKALLQPQ